MRARARGGAAGLTDIVATAGGGSRAVGWRPPTFFFFCLNFILGPPGGPPPLPEPCPRFPGSSSACEAEVEG